MLVAFSEQAPAAPLPKLVGLGLHQETGRDIYLGALYIPREATPPANLQALIGPRTMEYRIVARRTSIRSLLGSILLQSEIATGEPPSDNTAEFADALLSGVKSSLYSGDILSISLTDDGRTIAALNDYTVAASSDPAVANYILSGWLEEGGATTAFRRALLAAQIDASLQERLIATEPGAKRRAEIASWFATDSDLSVVDEPTVADGPTVANGPTTDPAVPAREEPEDAIAVAAAGAAEQDTQSTDAAADPASIAPETTPDDAPPTAVAEAIGTELPATSVRGTAEDLVLEVGALKLSLEGQPDAPSLDDLANPSAALSLSSRDLGELELDSEVLALGVQEYAQRLSAFHGDLVARVYRAIKYPKRAIRRSLQGRLELDITLRESGELVNVSVAESSGHSLLDEAALEAAETAMRDASLTRLDVVAVAEFGGPDGRVVVPVPVNFQLERN